MSPNAHHDKNLGTHFQSEKNKGTYFQSYIIALHTYTRNLALKNLSFRYGPIYSKIMWAEWEFVVELLKME